MQETFQVRRINVAREIGRPQPWIFSAARHPAIRLETIEMTTSKPRLGSVFVALNLELHAFYHFGRVADFAK
jgi:hypothetical protein